MRKIQLGSIDDLFAGLVTARDLDRLRAMMRLLTSGATGFAGLRAAAIRGLRQLVS